MKRTIAALSASLLVGCQFDSPSGPYPRLAPASSTASVQYNYPTPEELIAAGLGLNGFAEPISIAGEFVSSGFRATGEARFRIVNAASLTTTATVLSSSGSQIDQQLTSDGFTGWWPLITWSNWSQNATASTGGNTCDVFGTSTMVGTASLKALVNWQATTLYSASWTRHGTERSLPPCGGGGGGSGECVVWECQQYFWYEDGVPIFEWWECFCHQEYAE